MLHQHARMRTYLWDTPPSTLQPHNHLPDIPTPVPWGCYVHTWKGCVGLCPSPLFGCCCMHPGCSMVIKCMLSPAEQAHPYFHSLSSLQTILVTQPLISSNKHKFYQTFIDNIDFCTHA